LLFHKVSFDIEVIGLKFVKINNIVRDDSVRAILVFSHINCHIRPIEIGASPNVKHPISLADNIEAMLYFLETNRIAIFILFVTLIYTKVTYYLTIIPTN
jgi:hypothetical protein